VFAVSRGRLVWLLLGLVGAYVSGLVIVGFEEALQVAPVLALFQRDVLSGLSQEEIAGFIEQVKTAGRWEQSRQRPAWLSPTEA